MTSLGNPEEVNNKELVAKPRVCVAVPVKVNGENSDQQSYLIVVSRNAGLAYTTEIIANIRDLPSDTRPVMVVPNHINIHVNPKELPQVAIAEPPLKRVMDIAILAGAMGAKKYSVQAKNPATGNAQSCPYYEIEISFRSNVETKRINKGEYSAYLLLRLLQNNLVFQSSFGSKEEGEKQTAVMLLPQKESSNLDVIVFPPRDGVGGGYDHFGLTLQRCLKNWSGLMRMGRWVD